MRREDSVTAAQHKDVIERFDALLDGGDLRQLDELCTADLVNHSLAPGRPAGLEGTRGVPHPRKVASSAAPAGRS
jgi:hypothetical protein